MEKRPESRGRLIPYADIETGMLAGLWSTPIEGFEWRDDVKPLSEADERTDETWLVLRGAIARQYGLLRKPALAADFYAVGRDPTPSAIMRFAQRYGFLGDPTVLVPAEQPQTHPIVVTLGGGGDLRGESMSAWVTESLAFRAMWEAWDWVETVGRADAHNGAAVVRAREELAAHFEWKPDGRGMHNILVADGRGSSVHTAGAVAHPAMDSYPIVTSHVRPGDVPGLARFWVISELNHRLRGTVHPALLAHRDAQLRFIPESLMAAIHLRFAMRISEGIGVMRECRGCGNTFAPTRRNNLYCDKNCRERAGYRRRTGQPVSERDAIP